MDIQVKDTHELGGLIRLMRAAGIYDPQRQRDSGIVFDGNNTLTVPDRLAPHMRRIMADPSWRTNAAQAHLIASVADRRYAYEIRGVTYMGHKIATDRDARTRLAEAEAHAFDEPTTLVHWKTGDGTFGEFTAEQIKEIAAQVRRHVQDAYRREADTVKAIKAGLVVSTSQIEQAFA